MGRGHLPDGDSPRPEGPSRAAEVLDGPERWAALSDPDELATALADVRRRAGEQERAIQRLQAAIGRAPGPAVGGAARSAAELDAARRALATARADEAVLSIALAEARRRAAGADVAAEAAATIGAEARSAGGGVPRSVVVLALVVLALLLANGSGGWLLARSGVAGLRGSPPDAAPTPAIAPSAAATAAPPPAAGPAPTAASESTEAVHAPAPDPRVAIEPDGTAALAAPSPAAGTRRSLLDERFADNRRGWPSDPASTARLGADGYRLAARHPGRFVAVAASLPPARDVMATAWFRKVGGPPGGGYGLIVRDRGPWPRDGLNQAGAFYLFEAGDRGEVGVWRREGARWIELVPRVGTAAVRPGEAPNVLAVRALGRELTFLVNGVTVAALEDPDPQGGAVGLYAGGDLNEIRVERLLVETGE